MFHYWFLLPAGITIATLVMSSGVSGTTLWVPVYFLWLHFDISMAFWLGLLTVLFGKGSGVYRNWRDGSYDGPLIVRYLIFMIPAAVIGALIEPYLPERALVLAFGLFVFLVALVISWRTLRNHYEFAAHEKTSWTAAVVGGLMTGLISIGGGVMTLPSILSHRSAQRPGYAVGTVTILIFFTSIAAEAGRMRPVFIRHLETDLPTIVAVMIWAAPGVVIGGQIGPRLARLMPSQRHARLYFCAVLAIVGALTLARGSAIHPKALRRSARLGSQIAPERYDGGAHITWRPGWGAVALEVPDGVSHQPCDGYSL
jgi:uncharacterized protein